MKPKFLILILALFCFSFHGISQNVYNMNGGETVTVDENGHVLNAGKTTITKIASPVSPVNIQKEADPKYFENGRYRIPGYTPSTDAKTDEENYSTAKRNLYEKNPTEYQKWFGKTQSNYRIIVRAEEFQKMPDIKKQQILANPSKYYIEDVNINPDCSH